MYALADCNNFFVSCERAFQPELEGKAVVVLSNNDGCVVARSNESKALGVPMGTPFFKVKDLVDQGKLVVRSSNYTLYGDLSARVMSILASAVPKIEVYSIDEAYLLVDGMNMEEVPVLCHDLIHQVRQWVGIPISIGIAPTKTLAKVANHFAKKYVGYHGVCSIDSAEKREKALKLTPIDDVWGIGRRLGPKLKAWGLSTAWDFVCRPERWVYNSMGINGVRTWRELQGVEAVEDEPQERRQSICTSRSFADMFSDEREMSLRISDFAAICAHKLREEHSAASSVNVFMHTNFFREDMPQYAPDATIHLPVAANSTQEIVSAALKAMKLIWKPEFMYKKAGVVVFDIVDEEEIQTSLFDYDEELREKQDVISRIMDQVNSAGNNVLRLATQRKGHYAEGIRREHCSRMFSTSWDDMLEIH